MSQYRANSSPNLDYPGTSKDQRYDDFALQGVAANIKLLLKLIQDHQLACNQDKNDHRRMLRVATMVTILDNAKDRIEKCQSFGPKKPESELRRCNTDLRRNPIPRDKKPGAGQVGEADEEKERLRRELSSSLAAQRNLRAMCSSFGKEKQIMDAELSKKVHELSEMEELMNNLKSQNETLRQKVQECLSSDNSSSDTKAALPLQARNEALSEQLMRSLNGYRSMKRKLKAAQEENAMLHATVEEAGARVASSLDRVRSLKERMASQAQTPLDLQEEIVSLETMLECFHLLLQKHQSNLPECARARTDARMAVPKPSVLAWHD